MRDRRIGSFYYRKSGSEIPDTGQTYHRFQEGAILSHFVMISQVSQSEYLAERWQEYSAFQ